jgi:signal transduction histidine kinase
MAQLRRQVFVDRGLQLRFARFVLFIAAGGALLTGLAVFYTTYFILGEKLSRVYPQSQLISVFRTAHLALLISIAAVLPFIFYASLVFSHRVAGPLPKIIRALRAIGDGQFDQKLVLRQKDELRELAQVINDMAAKLKQRQSP